MAMLHHFFLFTTLILTFLHFLHPVFSQPTPQSDPSSPSTTISSLPATSTPTVFPYYNFTYPNFPDHYDSGIQVSYKDTIDVSWVANGLQHAPVLEIQCWIRNDSSSFIYYETSPSYTHNVFTSPSPSDDLFPFPVAPYRQYSPCQLRLLDPDQTSDTGSSVSVTSVGIFISEQTNSSTVGVTWSVDNAAPKVAVDAGVATTTSGSARMNHKGVVGGMWAFAGAVAAAMVML